MRLRESGKFLAVMASADAAGYQGARIERSSSRLLTPSRRATGRDRHSALRRYEVEAVALEVLDRRDTARSDLAAKVASDGPAFLCGGNLG
jgi:cyanophycinase-like exopeptidase